MTPLHLAAREGYAEIVDHLIKAGAQLEAEDSSEVSAWVMMVECTVYVYMHILSLSS